MFNLSFAGLGFPQYYTGVATELEYDTSTECLTTIQHQYEITECFSFLGICTEGNELIATHTSTVCEPH